MKNYKKILFLLIFCNNIFAGLSSNFTEIVIENLQAGKTYSLKKIFNMPYNVKNTGPNECNIKIYLEEIPEEKYLRSGYQILKKENFNWIKLEKTNFNNVKPGETVLSDIIISIPDDNSILGKKYQIMITAETYTTSTSSFGLEFAIGSILRFEIASNRLEMTQDEIDKLNINLNFKVTPSSFYVTNYKICDNKKYFVGSIFIQNTDTNSQNFIIKSLTPEEINGIENDYEYPPDPNFLLVSTKKLNIPSKQSKKVDVFLLIPCKEEYRNKKFQFVVGISPANNKKINTQIFTRIYVETK